MTRKTTIKESLEGLLETLHGAGVELTEDQAKAIIGFGRVFDRKLTEARHEAARKVCIKMDRKYREVFEKLMDNLMEHGRLVGRIHAVKEAKKAEAENRKVMVEAIDKYLGSCVEELVTEKSAIDLGKMKRYEQIVESMKGLVLENEDSVKTFKDGLEKKYKASTSDLVAENKALKEKVSRLSETGKALRDQIDLDKAAALVESKARDLPAFEAAELRKRLAGKTVDEVQKTFRGVLKTIQEEMAAGNAEGDAATSLDERISNILDEEDDGSDETDKAEQATVPVDEIMDSQEDEGDLEDVQEVQLSDEIKSLLENDDDIGGEEEPEAPVIPTDEETDPDDLDGVQLDESDRIDSRTMQFLIERYRSINPQGVVR